MLGSLYLEHLSDADLAFLGAAGQSRYDVRRDPDQLEALIDSTETFRALFTVAGRDPLLRGSPFLIFAVLVHRVVRDLRQATFIEEWVGPRQRVPVFDTESLRDFGADPLRRLFLAELLASYTNVASGSTLGPTTPGSPCGASGSGPVDGKLGGVRRGRAGPREPRRATIRHPEAQDAGDAAERWIAADQRHRGGVRARRALPRDDAGLAQAG